MVPQVIALCGSPAKTWRKSIPPHNTAEIVKSGRASSIVWKACPMGRALRAADREAPFGSTRRGVESGGEGACVSGCDRCRDWQDIGRMSRTNFNSGGRGT